MRHLARQSSRLLPLSNLPSRCAARKQTTANSNLPNSTTAPVPPKIYDLPTETPPPIQDEEELKQKLSQLYSYSAKNPALLSEVANILPLSTQFNFSSSALATTSLPHHQKRVHSIVFTAAILHAVIGGIAALDLAIREKNRLAKTQAKAELLHECEKRERTISINLVLSAYALELDKCQQAKLNTVIEAIGEFLDVTNIIPDRWTLLSFVSIIDVLSRNGHDTGLKERLLHQTWSSLGSNAPVSLVDQVDHIICSRFLDNLPGNQAFYPIIAALITKVYGQSEELPESVLLPLVAKLDDICLDLITTSKLKSTLKHQIAEKMYQACITGEKPLSPDSISTLVSHLDPRKRDIVQKICQLIFSKGINTEKALQSILTGSLASDLKFSLCIHILDTTISLSISVLVYITQFLSSLSLSEQKTAFPTLLQQFFHPLSPRVHDLEILLGENGPLASALQFRIAFVVEGMVALIKQELSGAEFDLAQRISILNALGNGFSIALQNLFQVDGMPSGALVDDETFNIIVRGFRLFQKGFPTIDQRFVANMVTLILQAEGLQRLSIDFIIQTIRHLVKVRYPRHALKVWNAIPLESRPINAYYPLLCETPRISKQVWEVLQQNHPSKINLECFSRRLNSHLKDKNKEMVQRDLEHMEKLNISADIRYWSLYFKIATTISEFWSIWERFRQSGLDPNSHTFNTALSVFQMLEAKHPNRDLKYRRLRTLANMSEKFTAIYENLKQKPTYEPAGHFPNAITKNILLRGALCARKNISSEQVVALAIDELGLRVDDEGLPLPPHESEVDTAKFEYSRNSTYEMTIQALRNRGAMEQQRMFVDIKRVEMAFIRHRMLRDLLTVNG